MSPEPPSPDRASQVAALLAAPLPSSVPAELRRAALRRGAPVKLAVIGSGFVLMGAFFVWMFFPWSFYREHRLAAVDAATVTGRVVATATTNLHVNKTPVVRYQFEFQIPGAGRGSGECYTTGLRWQAGSPVAVRYRPEEPGVCCIQGARLSQSGGAAAPVFVFPLVGVVLVGWVIMARRRMAWLLENGLLAEALVASVEPTLIRVNNRVVHRITLQRTDSPDGGTFTLKQTAPEVIAFANERMAANQPVYVVYDGARPNRAILPETL